MWPEFIHHLTLHFALVLPWALSGVGLYGVWTDASPLRPVVRWGGWIALLLATITAATGLIAGGLTGGEDHLQHHRYLGVMSWMTAALAATTYDRGVHHEIADLRKFGVGVWAVTAFATVGTGHWGVLAEHADVIPF